MAGGNIGGFFVNLGAKIDRASFNAADAALKGFESTAGKVTRALGFTTGSFLTMAKAAGAMETAELKAARAIGVSASKLNDWRISAGIAGTSGAALVGTMGQLEAKMQRLKLGQMDAGLAKNLGFLNINYDDFARMDANQRMRAVFNKADGMQDQRKAALLIQDTLGSAAREYYDYLKLSGKSLDQQLAEGRALNFTTEKSKREAMLFNAEINAVAQGAKSIATFLGSNIASKLTPVTIQIKGILINNRELIQSGIVGFVDRLSSAITAFLGIASRITPLIVGLIDRFGGLDQVIIKIGLGIGALKLTRMVGDITSIIRSVGLLKTALGGIGAGLLAGGLFLVLEDLAVYFSGGKSLIGHIIDNMDQLKEKFNIKLDVSGFKDLGHAIGDLVEKITGAESVRTGLLKIGEGLAGIAIDSLTTTVNMLSKLAEVIASLLNGDWNKAGDQIKEFFSIWAEGAKKMVNSEEVGATYKQTASAILEEGGTKTQSVVGGINASARKLKLFAPLFKGSDYIGTKVGWLPQESYDYFWNRTEETAEGSGTGPNNPTAGIIPEQSAPKIAPEPAPKMEAPQPTPNPAVDNLENATTLKKTAAGITPEQTSLKFSPEPIPKRETPQSDPDHALNAPESKKNWLQKTWDKITGKKELNDGIMRPDGTVTKVAPDDWVFAARHVEDLAAAFIPQGVTNNTMNAPASYVINQNISVSGGNSPAAAVKQQAYNGVQEAMLRSMNNSQRILQLMPGQR